MVTKESETNNEETDILQIKDRKIDTALEKFIIM